MSDHIFASLETRQPKVTRKIHIRRLYDVLQLCIHRNDLKRARRAWSILIRCKEIDLKTEWLTAVHLLTENTSQADDNNPEKLDFLRAMMLQYPEQVNCTVYLTIYVSLSNILLHLQRETVLRELVLRLILSGRQREALDELELYVCLPS
jgi:RNA polymerase I-specific transcription initiation factor RRN11